MHIGRDVSCIRFRSTSPIAWRVLTQISETPACPAGPADVERRDEKNVGSMWASKASHTFGFTIPETNIAPENMIFQKESSFPTTISFRGYVSFRKDIFFAEFRFLGHSRSFASLTLSICIFFRFTSFRLDASKKQFNDF